MVVTVVEVEYSVTEYLVAGPLTGVDRWNTPLHSSHLGQVCRTPALEGLEGWEIGRRGLEVGGGGWRVAGNQSTSIFAIVFLNQFFAPVILYQYFCNDSSW